MGRFSRGCLAALLVAILPASALFGTALVGSSYVAMQGEVETLPDGTIVMDGQRYAEGTYESFLVVSWLVASGSCAAVLFVLWGVLLGVTLLTTDRESRSRRVYARRAVPPKSPSD